MKTLFISYCSKDREVVDFVEKRLSERLVNYIRILRYERDVQYKESFKEFMEGIRDQDYVLGIVSDSFLKSFGCLFEMGEVLKDKNFQEKIHFVVLRPSDASFFANPSTIIPADIWTEHGRISYVKYWRDKYRSIESDIIDLTNEEALEERIRLKRIRQIKDNDLNELVKYINDHDFPSLNQLIDVSFDPIVKSVLSDTQYSFHIHNNYFDLLKYSIEAISTTTETDYNQIILLANTGTHSYSLVVVADRIAQGKQKYRIVKTKGLIDQAFAKQETICVNNVLDNCDYIDAVLQTKSELVVPIIAEGNTIGVINSESSSHDYYSPDVVRRIEELAAAIASNLIRLGYRNNMDKDALPYISLPA